MDDTLHHLPGADIAAVALDFKHIFPGICVGCCKKDSHDLVNTVSRNIHRMPVAHPVGENFSLPRRTEAFFKDFLCALAAHAHDSNAALAAGCGNGADGFARHYLAPVRTGRIRCT